jgi:hypothetical protein
MNRALDAIAGGWQLVGNGSVNTRWWTLPTTNWGPTGQVEIYGTKYPIQDCRSGVCYPGYLYWNGYIPANRINSYDAKTGKPNGVMGVPSNYKPAESPLIPAPANGGSTSDPNYAYYNTNSVVIPLKNGNTVRTTMDTSLHPWRNQFVLGPLAWNLNASLFKVFRIKEKAQLRLNADFFQVLNNPGYGNPTGEGIISLQNSANSPRVLQLTLRLTW